MIGKTTVGAFCFLYIAGMTVSPRVFVQPLGGVMLLLVLLAVRGDVYGQGPREKKFTVSIGGQVGTAPRITYQEEEVSGLLFSVFGELEVGDLIGRMQYSQVIEPSVNDDNFEGGYGFYGAFGYNWPLAETFKMPLMLQAGGAVVEYNNGVGGNPGNVFSDGGAQFGFVVAPYFLVTPNISIQFSVRRLWGNVGFREISGGLRLSL